MALEPPAAHAPARDLAEETPNTSGLTSRLLLGYVERELGRPGVEALLERCGLTGCEDALRDEGTWFSYATKVELLEAATELLGRPDAMRRMGAASLELDASPALRVGLRALGSPGVLYASCQRLAGRFSVDFGWEVLRSEPGRTVLHFRSLSGTPYHRYDCEYNRGLLEAATELFGLPPAQVRHDACGADGCDGVEGCRYDVRWSGHERRWHAHLGWAATAATALGGAAAALVDPALVPLVAVPGAAAGVALLRSRERGRRAAMRSLELELEEQRSVADRLVTSLHDLVADHPLDEVLERVAANAGSALAGKRLVLLVDEGAAGAAPGLRCVSSGGVPADAVAALERWVGARPELRERPLLLDEDDPALGSERWLPGSSARLGAVYATPLVVGPRRLGVLLALGHGFLPHDTRLLDTYAAQAALAVANAQHFERLERLAAEDSLTGLANHRAFHDALDRELARSARSGDRFSVVLLDLDDFRAYNERHGHAAGDAVLATVAFELRRACRDGDLAARLGGDELALLLPGTGATGARAVARRARAAAGALGAGVGLSFGVSEWPVDATEKTLLLARAAERQVEAKPAGRRLERGAERHAHRVAELAAAIGEALGRDGTGVPESGALHEEIARVCDAYLALAADHAPDGLVALDALLAGSARPVDPRVTAALRAVLEEPGGAVPGEGASARRRGADAAPEADPAPER